MTSRPHTLAAVGLLLLALSHEVRAAEGGVGAYAPGSFASSMDALPTKPGFALFNYFTFYNGNAGASRTLPIAGQVSANVEATIYIDTLGGFWITPSRSSADTLPSASPFPSCGTRSAGT